MGVVADKFNEAFRDHVVEGVPASGPNDPSKSDIRAVGGAIEIAIAAVGLGEDLGPAEALLQAKVDDARAAADEADASAQVFTDELPNIRFNVASNILSGTVLVAPDTGASSDGAGLTIPVGQSGFASLLRVGGGIDGATLAGETILITLSLPVSSSFTREAKLFMQSQSASGVDSAGFVPSPSDVVIDTVQDGERLARFKYLVKSTDRIIQPFVQLQVSTPTVAEETITSAGARLTYQVLTAGGQQEPVADATLSEAKRQLLLKASDLFYGRIPGKIVTVAPSGADFIHPRLACDAITDSSALNPYLVLCADGTYTDQFDWFPPPYVTVMGASRDGCVIHYEQSNDAASANIINRSTIYASSASAAFDGVRFINLTISIKNGRYAAHLDGPAVLDYTLIFSNVRFVHYGNFGAAATAWGNTNAIGMGVSSGSVTIFDGCDLIGENCGLGFHDNVNFTKPALVRIANSRVFATQFDRAGALQIDGNLGNGPQSVVEIEGSDIPSYALLGPGQGFRVSGGSNKPGAFRTSDPSVTARPSFKDEEGAFFNGTGATIPRKTVLALDGNARRVRPMTATDPASLFAGVAWEPIANGAFGRVKIAGALPSEDLLLDGVTVNALVLGDSFSIKAGTPGTLVKGGTQGLLRVTDPANGAPLGFFSATHQVAL